MLPTMVELASFTYATNWLMFGWCIATSGCSFFLRWDSFEIFTNDSCVVVFEFMFVV